MIKAAILLSGRGSNFRAIHQAVLSGEIENVRIVYVISNKENAEGLRYARQQGLNTVFLDPALFTDRENYDQALCRLLEEAGVDLICLAGYMRIVSDFLIDRFYGRIINIHPSLLPAFPGIKAQKQALDYGVKVTGCTVHFVDKGVDAGPVILQEAVPVLPDDTEQTLSARILEKEHILYGQAVALFAGNLLELSGRKVKIKGN